jgi:glucosamine--fructose-6-phosphate aminotransferase (isomerizing)
LAHDAGARTLAVVGNGDGPLASLAAHTLVRPVATVGDLPARWGRCLLNMSEYLAALTALFELGLGLAIERLGEEDRAAKREGIADAVMANAAAAAALEARTAALAATLVDAETVWTIGAGPNQGTARYAAAKFYEQLPLAGIAQDLEEWAHLEYFLTLERGRRSVVIVLAPPGNALDRAREITAGIARAGGRAIVITAEDDGGFAGAEAVLAVGDVDGEPITPLLYHLPAQLLVLHMARLRDCPHIPLRRRDDYELIRGGRLRETRAGLA